MPKMNLDEKRKIVEIEKIVAETKKTDREACDLERQKRINFWSEVAKIIGALIIGLGGFVTGFSQHQLAQKEYELADYKRKDAIEKLEKANKERQESEGIRDQAKKDADAARTEKEDSLRQRDIAIADMNNAIKQKEDAQKFSDDLKQRYSILSRKTGKSLVYIQFRGSLPRELMNKYRSDLEAQGYDAPGVERIAGDYSNTVKYFDSTQASEAKRIAQLTMDFFNNRGCPLKIEPEKVAYQGKLPKQIEAWIHHACKD